LAGESDSRTLLVDVSNSISEGLTVMMVYANRELRSFARTTAVLDGLGLTIVDARVVPLSDDHNLDTYCVLESDGSPISDPQQLEEIRHRVFATLSDTDPSAIRVTRRTPRQVRMFSTPVQITVFPDTDNQRTVIELVASDRPGLLSQIGQIFENQGVALQNAKILTIGERAEDVFFVTTQQNHPLSSEMETKLGEALREGLKESPQ
jgi:[protein-PII] uridylyltransferase